MRMLRSNRFDRTHGIRCAAASAPGRGALAAAVVIVVVLGIGVSTSAAATPWWHLASGARPTNLASEPGLSTGTDEVQEVTVSATEGDFFFANEILELVAQKDLDERTLPFDASPAEVQLVLEEMYGTGNVVVQAGATNDASTHSWKVTFTGVLADTPIPLIHPAPRSWELLGERECGELESFGLGSCRGEPTKIFKELNGGTKKPEVLQLIRGAVSDRQIVVTASNLGDAATSGAVTIADTLPPGLEFASAEGFAGDRSEENLGPVECPPTTTTTVTCTFSGSLPPSDRIEMRIGVRVAPGATAGGNEARISGGEGFVCHEVEHEKGNFTNSFCTIEAPPGEHGNFERVSTGPITPVSTSRRVSVSEAPTPFGVEEYGLTVEEEGGRTDTQAGSHPFQQTTTIAFNQSGGAQPAGALAKDLKVNLPPGLIGNPTPFPRCSLHRFLEPEGVGKSGDQCPPDTQVGVAIVTYHLLKREPETNTVPVFNIEPSVGEPARFGFLLPITPVFIDPSVRTGGDYGLTANIDNISQTAGFLRSEVTLWGVPGDTRHDNMRGWGCIQDAHEKDLGFSPCSATEPTSPPPFMLNPTACTGPQQTSVEADSWKEPSNVLPPAAPLQPMAALDGCDLLPFTPSLTVTPDTTAGSTPTGLKFDEHIPQESLLLPKGLAQSAIKGLTIALPQGVTLNPSAAEGLQSCSMEGIALTSGQAPGCPEGAKVGTVTLRTPLLPATDHFEGSIYLAAQNANPFGSLNALYLFAEDHTAGVRIKAAGEVTEDPVTGQLTAHFEEDPLLHGGLETSRFLPQLPAEDIEVHFFGGEHAPLASPAACGNYVATATFTPWSGDPAVSTSSPPFAIKSGPHGSPCATPLPFNPVLTAGTTNNQAGAFSPLTTTMSREDGQQDLQSIQLHMPPGLSGLLSTVKLCGEAQANEGTCGPESAIGQTTVSVGLGSNPFTVTGGRVYITGPYHGAPFGLSIVNPAKAGPIDLENDSANPANHPPCDCVVVRAKIDVDPRTAQLTITTDSAGEAHAIPHILDGVPLLIKHVNVTITRPGFTFNPTSCNPLSITGAIASAEGASSPLSVPFQVTNCAALKFTPHLTVSTAGKGSKANGASLTFRVAYPKGALGTQSWFNEAKFEIPKQLPARLTTIQKACLAATFESHRAACPPASIIGHAIVHTPVLPVPLEGPVYFVSYGGAKFPDAVMVLDGYGVHIELHGETLIKNGITSATFRNTPDVPFESLEVKIPSGPFSEFGTNLPHEGHDFCGQKLVVPTFFKASNGAEIHQNTSVGVSGCSTKVKIVSHKLKGRNLTVSVYVPAAGKLKASGRGLSSAGKTATATGTLTLTLHAKRKGRFATKVKLTFTPSKGRKQTKALSIRA